MERLLLLLICFLFLSQPNNCSSSLSFNSSTPLCHSHQSSALLHFRNSFSVGGPSYPCDGGYYPFYSYPPKNSWKMGTDCCGWDGVTCDTMTGHVIAVDLRCSRLQGPIHPNSTLFSLRHLQRLNLAYNDFHGSTISSKFGGFANMKHLNLTRSSFAGCMPPSLGKLTNLEWLDLSSNKLIGEIPIQLADLTSLEVLNLSENYLFGQIPQGKQFNTFMNDSYNGNQGLCGFPMTKACGNDEGQQLLPSSTTQEDDFKFENGFNWKVVLLGYSCGFIFGLGLGYLVFSSGKPEWLVNIVYGGRHNKV